MSNLTLAIDEQTLKQARIEALHQGTTVNALVRTYLEELAARRNDGLKTLEEIFAIADRNVIARGDISWTRDELNLSPSQRA